MQRLFLFLLSLSFLFFYSCDGQNSDLDNKAESKNSNTSLDKKNDVKKVSKIEKTENKILN